MYDGVNASIASEWRFDITLASLECNNDVIVISWLRNLNFLAFTKPYHVYIQLCAELRLSDFEFKNYFPDWNQTTSYITTV